MCQFVALLNEKWGPVDGAKPKLILVGGTSVKTAPTQTERVIERRPEVAEFARKVLRPRERRMLANI